MFSAFCGFYHKEKFSASLMHDVAAPAHLQYSWIWLMFDDMVEKKTIAIGKSRLL